MQTPTAALRCVTGFLHLKKLAPSAFLFLLAVSSLSAQTSPQQSPPLETTNNSNSTAPPIVRVHVPVVLVRVVVRDSQGKVIEDLNKDDFQIQDNKKPQDITNFAVEHPAPTTPPLVSTSNDPTASSTANPQASQHTVIPDHFVLILLDDLHVRAGEALAVRDAASKALAALGPTDQVAVYSISGAVQHDFTTDHAALTQVINAFSPHSLFGAGIGACPNISYYEAHLMTDMHDPDAKQAAIDDVWSCKFGRSTTFYQNAVQEATQDAMVINGQGDVEADSVFRRLTAAVNALSEMPGSRSILFVSDGFADPDIFPKLNPILDRAIKSRVVVNTLDPRGLFVPTGIGDASTVGSVSQAATRFHSMEETVAGDVLSDLADSTGGMWFHNRNDLQTGFRESIFLPPTTYVLGFSPQQKFRDGKYHKLRVTLVTRKGLTLQARTGYFAPKLNSDPRKEGEAEFKDALFNRDQFNDFPIDVQSRSMLKEAGKSTLSVSARIDIKDLPFRKDGGRSYDDLIVGINLFDDHGNFVTGQRRDVALRLSEETLQKMQTTGLYIKIDFDVKPGTYAVRVVARDSEGSRMSAEYADASVPGIAAN
jgi:VWFA-related protein